MACTAATQLNAPRQAFRACSRGSRRAAVVVRAAAQQQQPAGLDRRAALMGLAAALVAAQTRPALAEGKQGREERCAAAHGLRRCAQGQGRQRCRSRACCPRHAPLQAVPAAADFEIFYGLATPPTSYGGYGGKSQNAKEDGACVPSVCYQCGFLSAQHAARPCHPASPAALQAVKRDCGAPRKLSAVKLLLDCLTNCPS